MRNGARRRTLYTIGHSTRPVGELIDILRAFGVTRLVDIRRIPRSRTNPQFNLDVLPDTLRDAGIAYVQLAALGGLRAKSTRFETDENACWEVAAFRNYADYAETAIFREGLRELLGMIARETCAIMCAEAVWWRCHRRIVTDHLLARGVPVIHLFTRTKAAPASLTTFAVVGPRARVSYPVPGLDERARPEELTDRDRRSHHDQGTNVAYREGMSTSAKSAFHVGDHVSWSSEAGRVRGVITKKLTAPIKRKGYTVRASKDEPQYLIKSDVTDHVAVHKGSALRRLQSEKARAQ